MPNNGLKLGLGSALPKFVAQLSVECPLSGIGNVCNGHYAEVVLL